MFQFTPGNFGDVKQSVNSAKIDECAVISKSHYSTFHDVIHMQTFPDCGNLLLFFFAENNLAGEYNSASLLVNSAYLYFHSLSDKFVCVLYEFVRKLRKRNESGNFFIGCDYTAVYLSYNFDSNNRFIFKSFVNLVPMLIDFKLFL